jgi:hypothetical protein
MKVVAMVSKPVGSNVLRVPKTPAAHATAPFDDDVSLQPSTIPVTPKISTALITVSSLIELVLRVFSMADS